MYQLRDLIHGFVEPLPASINWVVYGHTDKRWPGDTASIKAKARYLYERRLAWRRREAMRHED